MIGKKATILLLLGAAAANNEAQSQFTKEIGDLEHSTTAAPEVVAEV